MDKDIKQAFELLNALRDEYDNEYQKRISLCGTFKDRFRMEQNIREKRLIGRKKYKIEKALEQLSRI
jgi:hypothetical protein